MASRIIDACAQMGSGDRKGDILESGIPAERLIENMHDAGVDQSVVYTVTWNRYTDKANREVAEAAQRYPHRFIPFARVNPKQADAEPLLVKALDREGFRGIRLRPFHDGFRLGDPSVRRVLDLARERGLPVETDGEKERTAVLKLVEDYPQVPIILTHLGDFDNWEWRNGKAYMEVMEKSPNLYMVTCFEIIQFFLEEAVHRAPDKVLFGSDSPTLPPVVDLKRVEVMKLDPATQAKVLGENLARILNGGKS